MMLDHSAKQALLASIEALRGGSSRRFEDCLWLGFGDHWTRIRAMLIRDGSIREVAGDGSGFRLLERGELLRRRLQESLAAGSGASGTTIAVALAGQGEAQ